MTETNPETGLSEFEPEALALIEEMGLEGQQELVGTRTLEDGDEVSTVCPYRTMSAQEEQVYRFLMGKQMKVEDYNRGPIPLRVLQVAALARREAWFEGLEVWCPENVTDKDPLLVGWRKKDHQKIHFILARWGEALEDFGTLQERAMEQWKKRAEAHLKGKLAEVPSAAHTLFQEGRTVYGFTSRL